MKVEKEDKESLSGEEFELALLVLIRRLVNKEIIKKEFCELAFELARKVYEEYYELEDGAGNLGDALYWTEELSYYECDEVMNNRFNYLEFYEDRKQKLE